MKSRIYDRNTNLINEDNKVKNDVDCYLNSFLN